MQVNCSYLVFLLGFSFDFVNSATSISRRTLRNCVRPRCASLSPARKCLGTFRRVVARRLIETHCTPCRLAGLPATIPDGVTRRRAAYYSSPSALQNWSISSLAASHSCLTTALLIAMYCLVRSVRGPRGRCASTSPKSLSTFSKRLIGFANSFRRFVISPATSGAFLFCQQIATNR